LNVNRLRFYRALARAYPCEFRNAFGDEMLQTGEEILPGLPLLGLVRFFIDIALRLPVEYAGELRQDVVYGFRALRSSRGFTLVALISLTLGIGVATAGFSELNGFIGRDIPGVHAPDELVLIATASYPQYQRYAARTDLFRSSLAYVAPVPLGILVVGRTVRT